MTDDQLLSGYIFVVLVLLVCVLSHCAPDEKARDPLPLIDTADSVHVLTTPIEHQTNAAHPGEVVRGSKVFEAGDCTVWRFQDSVGIHYLAEGRHQVSGYDVACSVAR